MDPDYSDREITTVSCSSNTFNVSGNGAAVQDNVLTISKEGVYILSGSVDDGRIVVEAGDQDKVQLVFNGFSITCSDHAPVFVKSGDKVFITLADNTENKVTDGSSYTALADDESNVDSAIFSKSDLTINGGGSLTVEGNMSHAIVLKDDLVVANGNINVTSVGSAVCGKDSVRIAQGTIKITSGGDGIKSDNTEDAEKGFVYIGGGTITINADTDGIQAETTLTCKNANITLTTSGGSENSSKTTTEGSFGGWGMWNDSTASSEDSTSAKGLKATGDIIISDSIITADTADDSIHSNANTTVDGGEFTITSGDDGIHSDTATTINSGNIKITKSYEGLEGSSVTINGGEIDITASDDGINAAGGNDMSAMGGRPSENSFTENSDVFIKITGGTVKVSADGDGIDSNTTVSIEGGTIFVDGPTNDGNGAIDSEQSPTISGGTIVALGSSGMAMGFSDGSEQASIMYVLSGSGSAGDVVTLSDSDGKELVSYTAGKAFNCINISTPDVTSDGTYTLKVGDDSYTIEMTSNTYSNGGGMGGFGGMGDMHGGGMGGDHGGNMPMGF